MDAAMPWIWLAAIVILSIAETCTTQMISIWFVIGAIAALISTAFFQPVFIQILIFIGVTFLALFLTKPLVNKALDFTKEDTNLGRYIGKTGIVICEINNTLDEGQVKIFGTVWTARSNNNSKVNVGKTVKVDSIKGVKLIVTEV